LGEQRILTVKINPNVCLMLVLLSAINGFSRVRIDDFYKAIEDGDLSLVQKQIRNGAELNYAFKPVTPLGHAIQRGSPEMVKLLLEAKANPNIAGKNNLYPLNVCTTGTMVDLLVAFGADVNINGNRRNRTPPMSSAHWYETAPTSPAETAMEKHPINMRLITDSSPLRHC
jgi:ankyrin repeat protein